MTDRHTLFEDDLTRVARERDEARAEVEAVRDALDLAETWWRKRAARYREALERITARHIAGASVGELADIARDALEGDDD